jgi:RND family efflux transporter MFP subunit
MSSTTRSAETRPAVAVLDQVLWQALGADAPTAEFATAWLTLQCRALGRAERGVLVLRQPDGVLAPVARWPEGDGGSAGLAQAAELAVTQRKGVATGAAGIDGSRAEVLAYPLKLDDTIAAVAAIECKPAGDVSMRDAMRQLQWGMASVEAAIRRSATADQSLRLGATRIALEIAATTLAADQFGGAARALATALATELGATRASVGWRRRRNIHVVAMSHGTAFSRRMDIVRRIAAAMDEALDQERSVAYPAASPLGTSAHAELSSMQDNAAILTVPLLAGEHVIGAVLLEFAEPVMQAQVDVVEAVAALTAPILAVLHRNERWLIVQLWDIALRETLRLIGPSHYGLKLSAAAVTIVVGFFAVFTTYYRVNARATVEGQTRRTIAAALDGYLATEHVRAGQTVHKGDLMATLDSGELVLQRLRWIAQREQRRLELDKALAAGQRAEVNINQAQINEATAQIALLDEQIARTRIMAPFDGLVLSGDLSQSVGAAVQRTQILFEVAPLETYRVIARVPDAEIDHIRAGQHGILVLTALPDDSYALEVTAITPTAEISEGANAFKVEAGLTSSADRLRPNMEGVAKISVGEHHLIWIWTHRLIAAVRLWLWSWWP